MCKELLRMNYLDVEFGKQVKCSFPCILFFATVLSMTTSLCLFLAISVSVCPSFLQGC